MKTKLRVKPIHQRQWGSGQFIQECSSTIGHCKKIHILKPLFLTSTCWVLICFGLSLGTYIMPGPGVTILSWSLDLAPSAIIDIVAWIYTLVNTRFQSWSDILGFFFIQLMLNVHRPPYQVHIILTISIHLETMRSIKNCIIKYTYHAYRGHHLGLYKGVWYNEENLSFITQNQSFLS